MLKNAQDKLYVILRIKPVYSIHFYSREEIMRTASNENDCTVMMKMIQKLSELPFWSLSTMYFTKKLKLNTIMIDNIYTELTEASFLIKSRKSYYIYCLLNLNE